MDRVGANQKLLSAIEFQSRGKSLVGNLVIFEEPYGLVRLAVVWHHRFPTLGKVGWKVKVVCFIIYNYFQVKSFKIK